MEGLQAIESDESIEGRERLLISARADDVVSRSNEMAGVEAHPDTRRSIEMLENRGNLEIHRVHRAAYPAEFRGIVADLIEIGRE